MNSELAWSQPDRELWQEAQLRGKPQFGKIKREQVISQVKIHMVNCQGGYRKGSVFDSTMVPPTVHHRIVLSTTRVINVTKVNTQLQNVDHSHSQDSLNQTIFVRTAIDQTIFVTKNRPNHSQKNLPTPIKLDKFKEYLIKTNYTTEKLNELVQGFEQGFSLNCQKVVQPICSKNLRSAIERPEIVSDKIEKEISLDRVAGPFSEPPFPNMVISPIEVVPKKDGKWRMIHHLSFPDGESVNDAIPEEESTVKYATVDQAVDTILQLERGCVLSKTDVLSAFRIVPIKPEEYHLVGFMWEGKYYYDKCLPKGPSSSCRTFEKISSAIEWLAKAKLGITAVLHILDDFLLLETHKETGKQQLEKFITMCREIGVPLAPEKTAGPATTMIFAGIELDTLSMEARLPPDKIQKCKDLIETILLSEKTSLRHLQTAIGTLNFACRVIQPGRAFLQGLIALTRGLKSHWHIRLSKEAKQDLSLWSNFLNSFNNKSFFLQNKWLDSNQISLYIDASGSIGYGALYGKQWVYGSWPTSWLGENITLLVIPHCTCSIFVGYQNEKSQDLVIHRQPSSGRGLKKTTK